MKVSLLVAALAMSACGPNYTAREQGRTQYQETPARAVTSLGFEGACRLDIYLIDGSKLYVGTVDVRICALTTPK